APGLDGRDARSSARGVRMGHGPGGARVRVARPVRPGQPASCAFGGGHSIMTRTFGLFLVAAVLTGCTKSPPSTRPAANAAPPGAFSVVHPEKKSLPKVIDQPGTIQA